MVESDPAFVLNQDMIPEFVPWKAEMDPSWALAVPEPDDEPESESSEEEADEVAAGAADEELLACC